MEVTGWIYGLKDSPNQFQKLHSDTFVREGATISRLAPTLFLWWREDKATGQSVIDGIVGGHVDDDLFAGSEHWKQTVLTRLRKAFAYTKWKDGTEPFTHIGRKIMQKLPNKNHKGYIRIDQKEYALGLKQILLHPERKKQA